MTTNIVIGTAGHIDHGKTTLVKALTGRDMDTLNDEIRRGITISPGFTWFETKGGLRAGLIDVPGHERFIKNMLAGAAGIDFAMLVVAANDGVKPQTLEHLWILDTLGLKHGIVVLTKCGMVDDLMVELACDDVLTALRGTFLESSEIVRVDSISGKGIPELREKLEKAVQAAVIRNTSAPARMNIDRVFSKKGFGAVVTGTLAEGIVSVGDELILYPHREPFKVRGIQVHETPSGSVSAGNRAALNLSGAKTAALKRGDVLSAVEMKGSGLVDVKLRLFPRASRGVSFWDRLRLYIGTRELFCRAVPLSDKEISPGGEDFCQLRLEGELFCKKDDYFVVRTYSPMETVGGGFIVDPNPAKHSRMDEALLSALSVKETGGTFDVLVDFIIGNPASTAKDIANYAGLGMEETVKILDELERDGIIVKYTDIYFHTDYIESIKDDILAALDDFHRANPLKKGMPKEELRNKRTRLEQIYLDMEADGLIKITGSIVSLHSFEIKLSEKQQFIKDEILSKLLKGGFAPPPLADITGNDKRCTDVLTLLSPEYVIFLDKTTPMHVEYYNKAKEMLMEYFAANTEITLALFRDLLGTSRKFAQLIIERFDDERITVRDGDYRKKR